MKWNYILAASVFLLPIFAHGEDRDRYPGCSNDECFSSAANLLTASALLAAVVAPRWLAPRTAHSYFGRHRGDIQVGGLISKSGLAAVDYDLSDLPESDFGIDTSLALATIKTGSPTLLRYKLIANYALVKTWQSRISLGSGLAVEKIMEEEPIYPGVPVQLLWHQRLTQKFRLKFGFEVYWLKKPIYRSAVQALFMNKNSDSIQPTLGYLVETNTLQGETTHYLLFGLLI